MLQVRPGEQCQPDLSPGPHAELSLLLMKSNLSSSLSQQPHSSDITPTALASYLTCLKTNKWTFSTSLNLILPLMGGCLRGLSAASGRVTWIRAVVSFLTSRGPKTRRLQQHLMRAKGRTRFYTMDSLERHTATFGK